MGTPWKVAVGIIGVLLGPALGLPWMFAPVGAAAGVGMVLEAPMALSTARGDIGGLFIGASILCLLGLRTEERRWLDAAALLIACVAIGRTVGIMVDGFATMPVVAIVVELVMVRVLIGASRSRRAATSV